MANKSAKKRTAPKKSEAKKSLAGNRTANGKTAAKKTAAKKTTPHKWSGRVNETSDALDLKQGIFKNKDPKKIAASLKKSATESDRKKASPFQSAMSMLNFYINRGGENISASQMKVLEKAKAELRLAFGRDPE
jgi:uncharacterized protein DUF3175